MTEQTIEDRIAARTDVSVVGAAEVSASVGGVAFRDMSQIMEFSKLMAVSGQAVPKHLRGQPGACLAITLQALNWRMDPFAVANKSYSVNDRIAYEAQLIHAVVEQRAPIKGRITGRVDGDGPTRNWTLSATTTDGEVIEYVGPEIGAITVKNSPLWKADPDQQLWYYSVRAMCRRHFPDVILGVYEREEILHTERIRDVTPADSGFAAVARRARTPEVVEAANIDGPLETLEGTVDGEVDSGPSNSVDADHASPDGKIAMWRALATVGAPGSAAFDLGTTAFDSGDAITSAKFDLDADRSNAEDWAAGWVSAEKSAATGAKK